VRYRRCIGSLSSRTVWTPSSVASGAAPRTKGCVHRALWLAEHAAGVWEIVGRLDSASFERVLEALRIARGSYVWERTRVLLTEAQLVA
jgi:hypothetical protein